MRRDNGEIPEERTLAGASNKSHPVPVSISNKSSPDSCVVDGLVSPKFCIAIVLELYSILMD